MYGRKRYTSRRRLGGASLVRATAPVIRRKVAPLFKRKERKGAKVPTTGLLKTASNVVSNWWNRPRNVKPVTISGNNGNELTRFTRTVGSYPKLRPHRLLKLMQSGMTEAIYRHQAITNHDTNVGAYPLSNRTDTTTGQRHVPIHLHELTQFPNNTTNVRTSYSFYWTDSTANADLAKSYLPNQNPDGTRDVNGYLDVESLGGGALVATPNVKKACHEWSDVRLLLYGARKRTTIFYVDFIRINDEFANPFSAAQSDSALKDLFRQLQSRLIYSTLQTFNGDMNKKIQFVKRFKYYIPAGNSTDLDTIGKVKEVRLFLKQGNVYNMAWSTGNTADQIAHAQTDGTKYTNSWTAANHPWHGSRLFMFIRAFAPEARADTQANWNAASDAIGGTNVGAYMAAADPLYEPSYDVIIRNKWLLP